MDSRVSLLAVCLLAGCACPSTETYPIGLYGVRNTNDFPVVREAGFNVVTGPAQQAYLDAAQRAGLSVLASPSTSAGPKFDAKAARRTARLFDAHPALWGWYLVDEPELAGISPDAVREAERNLKWAGARKPTALALYKGHEALHYANIADITMIDRYPVPWLPLASFGQHMRMARLALGPSKPLIAIVQAFDWSYYPDELPRETNLREPTYAELRNMVYVSLAQRATGLFFYAFDSGRWRLSEHPQLWQDVKQVVAEVNERLPLFQAEHLWWSYSHGFSDYPHRFNEALESSIASGLLRVSRGNSVVPAGDYLLAVNTTARPQRYSITAPPRAVAEGEDLVAVVGEERSVRIVDGWLTDEFEEYAVHVYGPLAFP